jgi:D-tyrosyl-tRNA(Tyr) deacylase
MKAVIQRVLRASVHVHQKQISEINQGLLVLLGVARGDQEEDAVFLANKISALRIFEDSAGKMNLSVQDVRGAILAVPQFTLLADCRRGRRPDFTEAAPAREGENMYNLFCQKLELQGLKVKKGSFQEHMQVTLVNDGPVTIILDSDKRQNP